MTSSIFIRLGGLAAILGGVVYTAVGLLVPFLQSLLFILLAPGAMAAIAALHVLQKERYGLLGALASLTAFTSIALVLVSSLGIADGLPWPIPERIFTVGSLVVAVSMLALGAVTIAVRELPRWCGASLVVGGIIFAGWLVVPMVWLLEGVVWALVGYAVFRAGARLPERSSRVR
ncbi:MAG: hypothetical protein ACR2JR_13685 [Rubrobacteraceae bacterium]